MKVAALVLHVTLACILGVIHDTAWAFPGKDGHLSIEIPEPIVEDVLYENEPELKIANVSEIALKAQQLDEGPEEKVSYAGCQLWRVILDTNDKLRLIGKLKNESDITTWGGNTTAIDIMVREKHLGNVRQELDDNLINFEVIMNDVQKAIDEENPPREEDDELENRQGHRLTFTSYHRLSDIHGYLDYLAETYPSLCKTYVIGRSVNGKPLKVLRISNGNPGNKAVWVDGGIHAREWITPATVTYIINTLVLNYESEPQDIQNIDWYFLPVANPDGYEYSHTNDRLWRKNRARSGQCAGTDLNRNFGYRWGGKGNGKNPCQEIYGGTGPFSEPETAAIRNFITSASNANWKAYISYHSYGQYILYPWGYDRVVPPDHQDLQQGGTRAAIAMRNAGGATYTVGPAANTLYPAAGGSDDWAKGAVRMKYAYTIELRDNGRYGFILPASYIQPTAKEGLAALRVIGQAAAAA